MDGGDTVRVVYHFSFQIFILLFFVFLVPVYFLLVRKSRAFPNTMAKKFGHLNLLREGL